MIIQIPNCEYERKHENGGKNKEIKIDMEKHWLTVDFMLGFFLIYFI